MSPMLTATSAASAKAQLQPYMAVIVREGPSTPRLRRTPSPTDTNTATAKRTPSTAPAAHVGRKGPGPRAEAR